MRSRDDGHIDVVENGRILKKTNRNAVTYCRGSLSNKETIPDMQASDQKKGQGALPYAGNEKVETTAQSQCEILSNN